MEYSNSSEAIYNYKCHSKILDKRNGILHKALINAIDEHGIIYSEETEFAICINRYGDEELSIIWNLPDSVYHRLGLRGGYSAKFCAMNFSTGHLMIKDSKTTISIGPIL